MRNTSGFGLALLVSGASLASAACDKYDSAPQGTQLATSKLELRAESGRILIGDPAVVTFSELAPERVEVMISAQDASGWWTFTGYVPVAEWERGVSRLELTDRPGDVGQANSGEYSDSSEPSRWAPRGTVVIRREVGNGKISGTLNAEAGYIAGEFHGDSEASCFIRTAPDHPYAELDPNMESSFCRPARPH